MNSDVMISVNPDFKPDKEDLQRDLWIVISPQNLITADDLRADPLAKSVTTFTDRGNAVTNIIMILPAVLDHHPDCTYIIVHGLASDEYDKLTENTPELSRVASQQDALILKHIRQ